MKNFNSGLVVPSTTQSPILKKEIMWGCEQGGSDHFPRDIETIHIRNRAHSPKPLDAFREAFTNAVKRVWILDGYFLKSDRGHGSDDRILTILEWLHPRLEASDIRILTRQYDGIDEEILELFQIKQNEINNTQARRNKLCSIQVNTLLSKNFDFIHDRFAIVDDELWHFGATVGGFHPSVNAASRGWCAVDSGAIEFFKLAWEKCKEK